LGTASANGRAICGAHADRRAGFPSRPSDKVHYAPCLTDGLGKSVLLCYVVAAAYCSLQADSASWPWRWQKSPKVSLFCRDCLKKANRGTSVGTTSSVGTRSL